MRLHALGIDYHHDSDFLIDRPNGSGDSLVLIFKTPAVLQLNNNVVRAPMGSAVVFSAEYHQRYGADGAEYVNHWVHFDTQHNEEFFHRIGLPVNTLIPSVDMAAVERVLELLSLESLSESKGAAECCDLLLRLLLTKLADGMARRSEQVSLHSGALKELRAEIYRDPAGHRSIEELARRLSVSASYFQHLYKQEFSVSCYEDIISARHAMAKYYLRNTALPISRIAELCGYENDVHFIRQFKKRMGMTAGEYRKKM